VTTEQDWHSWRSQGIGGSDIGALLGLSTWTSPWSLWADKCGLLPHSETSERQQIGKDAEPFLSAVFERLTGLCVVGEQTWCHHPEHPIARCTVDGFVARSISKPNSTVLVDSDAWAEMAANAIDLNGGSWKPSDEIIQRHALGTVQFKTDAQRSWKGRDDLINGVPAAIEAQCQWEMGVTSSHRCWLVVGFAGWTIEVFELTARPDDFIYMLEAAERFWADHVVTGNPPAVDASDATARALAVVYRDTIPGVAVPLDSIHELVMQRAIAQGAKGSAEKTIKAVANEIRALMADAEVGTIDGEPVVTLRTQEGRKTTCAECGHVTQGEAIRVLRNARKAAS
jgi:putative phage-type endonuclease